MFACRSKLSLTLFIHRTGRDHSCSEATDSVHSFERQILFIATHLAIARSRAHTHTHTVSSLSECLSPTSIKRKECPIDRYLVRCCSKQSPPTDIKCVCLYMYIFIVYKKRTNERTNGRTRELRTLIVRKHSVEGEYEGCCCGFFFFTRKREGLTRQRARCRAKNSTDSAAYRCVASANEGAECKAC